MKIDNKKNKDKIRTANLKLLIKIDSVQKSWWEKNRNSCPNNIITCRYFKYKNVACKTKTASLNVLIISKLLDVYFVEQTTSTIHWRDSSIIKGYYYSGQAYVKIKITYQKFFVFVNRTTDEISQSLVNVFPGCCLVKMSVGDMN